MGLWYLILAVFDLIDIEKLNKLRDKNGICFISAPIIAVLLFLFAKKALQHTVSVLTSTVLLITAALLLGVLLGGKLNTKPCGIFMST